MNHSRQHLSKTSGNMETQEGHVLAALGTAIFFGTARTI